MSAEARPLVVFGGGALGAAVARLGVSRGVPVTVASRTPREHAGWWRRFDLLSRASLDWVPKGASLVVAVGPGGGERAAACWGADFAAGLSRLRAARPASILVAGPAGVGGGGLDEFDQSARSAHAFGAAVVRVPALLATGSGWAGTLAADIRVAARPRVSVALPPARALVVEDAARVVFAELAGGRDVVVTGSELVSAAGVVEALVGRYGQPVRGRLFGTGVSRECNLRLAAQANLENAWDEALYGPRLGLAAWVDRLPGPRRRRAEG